MERGTWWLTVKIELEPVGVDMMKGNAELRCNMLHNAAETTGDEENVDIALVQIVDKLPE